MIPSGQCLRKSVKATIRLFWAADVPGGLFRTFPTTGHSAWLVLSDILWNLKCPSGASWLVCVSQEPCQPPPVPGSSIRSNEVANNITLFAGISVSSLHHEVWTCYQSTSKAHATVLRDVS